jgi:hypothetical protein
MENRQRWEKERGIMEFAKQYYLKVNHILKKKIPLSTAYHRNSRQAYFLGGAMHKRYVRDLTEFDKNDYLICPAATDPS